ncbi:post-GPI attachment to proteins factor 2 [Drosophila guanche]|uniref:post-GPI attachment to proteins factor 2 n=1 Tax=Drosophila guanche TaxID=7266 RepID=UPI001471E45F|nr:post-GPI attachment to proteins factor 2 [Drosophila guanche]
MHSIPELPISVQDVQPKSRIRIRVAPLLAAGHASVPIAVIFYLFMAILTNYEGTTYTACTRLNVFPSLSAVARSQHSGWQITCCTNLPFSLLTSWFYSRYYRRSLPRKVRLFGCLLALLIVQTSCSFFLWGMYPNIAGESTLHRAVAISLFVSCAILMAGCFVLHKYYICEGKESQQQLAYRLKCKLVVTYFTAVPIMWFCYFLHEHFCFPFAYSVFGLCEFVNICSTFLYLATCYFDFYNVHICHDQRLGFFLSEF